MMSVLYAIQHKGKIAILLLAVIFLELFCSNTFSTTISQIGESFNEVYSDRILAQDYIFKMAKLLHNRQHESEHQASRIDNWFSSEMALLLVSYEKTKLTPEEVTVFGKFKKNMLTIKALEINLKVEKSSAVIHKISQSEGKLLHESLKQLDRLSEIQISRVKELNEASQKTVSFSSLLNEFGLALLIVIGLTIQILIFSNKSTRPKQPQNQFLN